MLRRFLSAHGLTILRISQISPSQIRGRTSLRSDRKGNPAGEAASGFLQEDEAVIVRRIFDTYVEEELTVRQIAKRLTLDRIPTPRNVGQWSWSAVDRILREWRISEPTTRVACAPAAAFLSRSDARDGAFVPTCWINWWPTESIRSIISCRRPASPAGHFPSSFGYAEIEDVKPNRRLPDLADSMEIPHWPPRHTPAKIRTRPRSYSRDVVGQYSYSP